MANGRFDLVNWFARYGTILFLLLLVAGFSWARPDVFPTKLNLLNVLNQASILLIIASGLTVCLVMGLFDLSIAAMATLGGYVVCKLLVDQGDDPHVWLTVAGVLLLSGVVGVLNGALVSYLGVSAFIETLAMGSIITGAILGYSESRTVLGGIPEAFLSLGQEATLGIPNPVIVMGGVALLLWLLLEHTQAGRNLYAIGGNSEAARLSGIAIKRYALVALGISAACAALGGMVAAANLGAGRPQGVGDTYLLNAFAAVFIGASTLRPGQFHILGTLVGVLLIGVISNGLSILGVQTFWQYIVQGVLLIAAMFGAGMVTLRRR
ncbi:MAG: ABC transporter permease [Betaproteobacteria bacterium]|jgi:ribose transport system permease protein|nr:ABC transporter permease [Rhodocyclaceae bacterium]MCA3143639.1 ABC transporter permease [Rhodocyclaceae bacterium]